MDPTGTGTRTLRSNIRGEIWTLDFVDGRQKLLVKVHMDCPECGQQTIQIDGHHVLALMHILSEAAEQHPELVNTKLTLESQHAIDGIIPNDPNSN